jgi:hypothetical protein
MAKAFLDNDVDPNFGDSHKESLANMLGSLRCCWQLVLTSA